MPALSPDLLEKMDAYWRAANYLSVGQIYLQDNPLLESPLERKHIKPRLLGHWGTTTGLNFIYVHLNRLIKERDLNMIYVIGPGHGGPGLVAHSYLEGSYTERYPNIERNRDGLQRLFRQFSCLTASLATSRRKRPGLSMKGANWVTASSMPTARRSTIQIWSWPASSATVRRKPVRLPRAGTPTNF
jgi:XFP N-terminal domain